MADNGRWNTSRKRAHSFCVDYDVTVRHDVECACVFTEKVYISDDFTVKED